jgi:hypothetical protein
VCNSITENSVNYWSAHLKSLGYPSHQKEALIPAWAVAEIGAAVIGGK